MPSEQVIDALPRGDCTGLRSDQMNDGRALVQVGIELRKDRHAELGEVVLDFDMAIGLRKHVRQTGAQFGEIAGDAAEEKTWTGHRCTGHGRVRVRALYRETAPSEPLRRASSVS